MPTLSNITLPPPSDWQEFENMVKSALELKWNRRDLTRHGRQGQAQNGVDIYCSNGSGGYIGIQCKLTVHQVSEQIIMKEVGAAESFQPSISCLIIATSAQIDANIQEFVRNLSSGRTKEKKFDVQILFWQDIEYEIKKDNSTFKLYYPQFALNSVGTQDTTLSLRSKDIEQLKEVLNYIDFDGITFAIDRAPKVVELWFFNELDCFNITTGNPLFYVNDKTLWDNIKLLKNKWNEINSKSIEANAYQHDNGSCIVYTIPCDVFRNADERVVFYDLVALYNDFKLIFHEFITFINKSYPEVNLYETSLKARQWKEKINN